MPKKLEYIKLLPVVFLAGSKGWVFKGICYPSYFIYFIFSCHV